MIIYRNAKKDDLSKIAKIHKICFPEYLLTYLGNKLIGKRYEEYINENAPFVVAENESNEIIGFCMGYITGSKARINFENKYKLKIAFKIFVLCLKLNKKAWKRIYTRVKALYDRNVLNKVSDLSVIKGALLSICVIDDYKGTEVATNLLKKFEDELILKNIKEYTLSSDLNNERGLQFYKKNGMKVFAAERNSVYFKKELN